MKVTIVLVICFPIIVTLSSGHRLFESQNSKDNFAPFVKNLMEKLNTKNSETHDVVILPLGLYKSSIEKAHDVYEELIRVIPDGNVVTTPKIQEVLNKNNIRKAAVIIIVSDVHNGVSFTINKIKVSET
jgi:hypothetical protein